MKKFNKFISLLLAVIMMVGALSTLMAVTAFAEDDVQEDDGIDYDSIINTKTPEDYTEHIYRSADEKIASMRLAFRNKGYKIYVDDYSGEVAIVNEATNEKLFTNPWDVASDKSSNMTTDDSTTGSIKEQILSQIELSFSDITGQNYTYTSFRMASMKNQITVKNIKGGIRVEYTIGREQAKMLVPHYIEAERFYNLIKDKIAEGMKPTDPTGFYTEQFLLEFTPVSKYVFKLNEETYEVEFVLDENGNKQEKSDVEKKKLFEQFPALKEIDVMFTLAEDIKSSTLTKLEQNIKTYCPEYSYEELDYDHEMTKYESDDENPPVFKMALEYTIDEHGLSVRLPANGIRFNESMYTLNSLTVLPYMGAGSNWTDGYNFMPDGSGALYEFDDADSGKSPVWVYNQVYGTDYAYHELSGTYEKTIRYPVFGTVVTSKENTYITTDRDGNETEYVIDGSLVDKVTSEIDKTEKEKIYPDLYNSLNYILNNATGDVESKETKSGFVAIIEEGDALTKIASYHGGNQNDYNSVKMQFTPRPSDSYNLQESISVSGLGEWTVVSERKYLGSYKMRYIMLSDADTEPDAKTTVYDASWFGMAVAYRDYLERNSILSPIAEDDITEDIPLYIESFGAIETVERILSIPVNRMTALTTFDNVEEMYTELQGYGIENVNFKLTGFANGGMYSTVPKKVKFESVVGGKKGFQELLDFAADAEKKNANANVGIFPDFDFAYITAESAFDGLSLSKHAAKTIDDRYASKRVYSATQQKYINYYDLVVSPAYFSEFYEKLTEKYLEFDGINGISVGTLGSSLNSDFDEDEPYNREDSKEFTIRAFEYLDENLGGIEIMTSGGNAYTWKYVDHMLDVALDSSRQSRSSNAVPFLGVVLHGSIQFAGDPLNMEGDIQYAMLKAIENGASPYFVLSYQNTENLKEDSVLSKYYSIRYDIWKSDLISTYNTLNSVLSDVQDKYIINHEFVQGERVPDVDEIEADIIESMEGYIEFENNYIENLKNEAELALANARKDGLQAEQYALQSIISTIENYNSLEEKYNTFFDKKVNGVTQKGLITSLKDALKSQDEKKIASATRSINNRFTELSGSTYKSVRQIVKAVENYIAVASKSLETIKNNTTNKYIINEAETRLQTIQNYYGEDRLIVSQPVQNTFNRELVLLSKDEWINGVPTYAYGIVTISVDGIDRNTRIYAYVVGSDERGYDFYQYDTASAQYTKIVNKDIVNAIIGANVHSHDLGFAAKAIKAAKVSLNGEAVDYKVYMNGKLVEADVYYDAEYDVYYSKEGNGHQVYYKLQAAYAALLESSDNMINAVIGEVTKVDATLAQSFKEKYNQSMTGNETNNEENTENTENETESKYVVDNIVIVTYGDDNGAYKYVILNYNNFAVKITFGETEYTIPGYDFVALKANA